MTRKKIRIDNLNYERLRLTKGNQSLSKKLNEILNLYYENFGGKRELEDLGGNLEKLKKLI